MDKQFFFERNLLALSSKDPALCSRLSAAETTLNRYRFLESRGGEPIPAWVDSGGTAHPLHSLVDPRREGERLAGLVGGEGFLIFLGLGGGYAVAAALEREETRQVLVIDYDINGMAELLCSKEYITIFKDPRFHLLIDPPGAVIEHYILDIYQPALCGGIRTLPLRTRTGFSPIRFGEAGAAVESAIAAISADYSVQAYFGTRWFSNIVRNVLRGDKAEAPVPPVREAAIIAAGPSLDAQLPEIVERRGKFFLLATDTSLPALLSGGIEPDGVVSIDCQHISYYHFMEGFPDGVPLFLDLASPPLVASRSRHPCFFSGGHPLTRYISQYWRPFPQIDTAGANVTYAALSLAEYLGVKTVTIYGADFSYPLGRSYARGTYIHSYFAQRQNRLGPLENHYSAFLFRVPLDKRAAGKGWYYETGTLKRYREGLEEKIRAMQKTGKKIIPAAGLGAPIGGGPPPNGPNTGGTFPGGTEDGRFSPVREAGGAAGPLRLFSSGAPRTSGRRFLEEYRKKIGALPGPDKNMAAYREKLGGEERLVFATLLPEAAAIKRHQPELKTEELLEAVRKYCLKEIDQVLGGTS